MAGEDYFDYLYRQARENGFDRNEAFRAAKNSVRNHDLPNQPRTYAHESSRHHRDSDDEWERYARNGRPTGNYHSHRSRADGGGSHAHAPYNTTEYAPRSDNRHRTEGKDRSQRHERHHQSSHRDSDERWEQFAQNGRHSHRDSEHPGRDSWSNTWTKDGRTYNNIGSHIKFYNPEKGRMDEYYSDSTSSYHSGSDADDYPYFSRPSPQFGGMKDSFGNFFPQGARSKGHHQAEKDPFDFDDFWEDLGGRQHSNDRHQHSKDHRSRGQDHGHSDYHEFPAGPHAKDYYAVLGVSAIASAAQIRKAYQKLALQYHPDRVPEYKKKEATDKMAEINEAYEVLRDEIKKARYDAARRS